MNSARAVPIFEHVEQMALRHPDAVAVRDEGGVLTYSALVAKARALGQALDGQLARSAALAIALPVDRFYPVAMLGALAAGRPYVPLDLNFPVERLQHVLLHSGAQLVLVNAQTHERLAAMVPPGVVCWDVDAMMLSEVGWTPPGRLTDVAYVIYTSGSTGQAKGVYQTQDGLWQDVSHYVQAARLSASDVLTGLYSPSVNGGLRDVYGALLTGATLALMDIRRMGLLAVAQAVSDWGVTIFHAMPPVLRVLLRDWACDRPHAVRLVYVAGDRLFATDVALLRGCFGPHVEVYTGIGSTECATLYAQWFVPPDWPLSDLLIPVGRPAPGRRVWLEDEKGGVHAVADCCPDVGGTDHGAVGEVVVESNYLAQGYWQDSHLTADKFAVGVHDPLARVYRTGDMCRLRPDGLLDFVGRVDRQVKVRGYRVEPVEAEGLLRTYPGVTDAAVLVHWAGDDAVLVACIAVDEGVMPHAKASGQCKLHLAAHLPAYACPVHVWVLPALPVLGNFKLDQAALQRFCAQQLDRVANSQLPRQDDVAALWWQTLKLAPGDEDDAFEALGGDSLKALELHVALEKRLGHRLQADWFSKNMSLAQARAKLTLAQVESFPDDVGQRSGLQLWLFPPASGVSPVVLGLRDALAKKFDVCVLSYPKGNATAQHILSISELAEHTLTRVRAGAQAENTQVFFGFSYGARVAHEASVRWEREGSTVRLVIADIALKYQWPPLPIARVQKLKRWVLQACVGLDACLPLMKDSGLLAIMNWVRPTQRNQTWMKKANVVLETIVFQRQIRRWHPGMFKGETCILVTVNTLLKHPDLPQTLGWAGYCEHIEPLPLGGEHVTFFKAEHQATFLAALNTWLLQVVLR